MHPALSIIVFTTASGLGYGLAAVLGLGLLDPAAWSTKIAHVLALLLIGGGLISSTLHLGNPQRAWRAFAVAHELAVARRGDGDRDLRAADAQRLRRHLPGPASRLGWPGGCGWRPSPSIARR
jgi:hypothetical protein